LKRKVLQMASTESRNERDRAKNQIGGAGKTGLEGKRKRLGIRRRFKRKKNNKEEPEKTGRNKNLPESEGPIGA